jgi:hypothetical protein
LIKIYFLPYFEATMGQKMLNLDQKLIEDLLRISWKISHYGPISQIKRFFSQLKLSSNFCTVILIFSAFSLRKRSYCPHFVYPSATASSLQRVDRLGWFMAWLKSLWANDLNYGGKIFGGRGQKVGGVWSQNSFEFRLFTEIIRNAMNHLIYILWKTALRFLTYLGRSFFFRFNRDFSPLSFTYW